MTIPDHDRLAGYFEEIYEALTARGVPQDRLPSPWLILSHVLEAVSGEGPYEALAEWISDYAALEATEGTDEDEDAEGEQDPEPSRRRPAYLKALRSPTEDVEEESPESPESESPEESPESDTEGSEYADP